MEKVGEPRRRPGLLLRCLVTWGGVTVLGVAVGWACASILLSVARPTTPEEALLRVAAASAAVCLPPVWWAATSTCWHVARGTLTRVPDGLVRRVVLVACGGAVALLGLAPAHASTPEGRESPTQRALHGLPLPERVSVEEGVPRQTHVVQTGESLWSIAAGRLGRSASDAAVASHWRTIHDLNADTVADPHLIHPGQSLRLPASATRRPVDSPAPAGPEADLPYEGDRP